MDGSAIIIPLAISKLKVRNQCVFFFHRDFANSGIRNGYNGEKKGGRQNTMEEEEVVNRRIYHVWIALPFDDIYFKKKKCIHI